MKNTITSKCQSNSQWLLKNVLYWVLIDSSKFLQKQGIPVKQHQQKQQQQQQGFQWGNLLGVALKLLVGGSTEPGANDKMDTITQLTVSFKNWISIVDEILN